MKFLSTNDVIKLTTLSRSTITRKAEEGLFPKARRIMGGTRIVFIEDEVKTWMDEAVA